MFYQTSVQTHTRLLTRNPFETLAAAVIVRLSTEKEGHLPFCQRRLFFVGAWSNLVCEVVLSSAALMFAPLSLISPIGGMSVVFAMVYAWFGLFGIQKEKASPRAIGALLVTLVGITVAAIQVPATESLEDLDDASRRLVSWAHVVYFFIGWTLSFGWLALNTFDTQFARIRPAPSHWISAPLSGFTSGWVAAYSLTSFKLAMTALRRVLGGDMTVASNPFVWICALIAFPMGCLQMYTLNITLGAGGVNYAMPWYTVMGIVLSITMGGFIYGDFDRMGVLQLVIFWAGVVISGVGLFILSLMQAKKGDPTLDPKIEPTKPTTTAVQGGEAAAKTKKKEAPPKPVAPVGYVPDMRCFFCGVALPCCANTLWLHLTAPRDIDKDATRNLENLAQASVSV